MNSAIINFTTEPQLKKEAQRVAKKLGIPLSLALNNYLKEFISTKRVVFSEEIPSEKLLRDLDQSFKEIKEGKVTSFKNHDEVLAYLDREIEDEKRKQASH